MIFFHRYTRNDSIKIIKHLIFLSTIIVILFICVSGAVITSPMTNSIECDIEDIHSIYNETLFATCNNSITSFVCSGTVNLTQQVDGFYCSKTNTDIYTLSANYPKMSEGVILFIFVSILLVTQMIILSIHIRKRCIEKVSYEELD